MLRVLILIERGELDEWAVRLDRCPLVETDDQSVNGKEKVVVRLLQSLCDGVKLSLVAAKVIGLRLAWNRAYEVGVNAHGKAHHVDGFDNVRRPVATLLVRLLITYDVMPKFKSFLSSAIQMGDDYVVSSFMNKAKLFDVIYTNEYIDKINSLISQKGEMISIDTRHLGLYKSERWKFQNESRFKIIVMPKNNNYVNVPNQASDFDILFNMMSSLAPSMASQSPIKTKHIDIGIKEEKLNEIEVMMGHETTEAERYIVEMLLSKFENSSIKDSYFKGKIKSK